MKNFSVIMAVINFVIGAVSFVASWLTIRNFIYSKDTLKEAKLYKAKLIKHKQVLDIIEQLKNIVKRVKSKLDVDNRVKSAYLHQINMYIDNLINCYPDAEKKCSQFVQCVKGQKNILQANIDLISENVDNIIQTIKREQDHEL